MVKYENMTQEDFDRLLMEILKEESIGAILFIPGVYELLAEYYNNEVLDAWEEEEETK